MALIIKKGNKLRDLSPVSIAQSNLCYAEFKNLLMNAVKIERTDGIDLDFIDETYIKDELIESGVVGFDRTTGKWSGAMGEGINEYGLPTRIIFKFRNGATYTKTATYEPEENGAYYIKALPTLLSFGNIIRETTDFMANCDVAIMQNINACKMPFIVVARNGDLELSIKQAIMQQQNGEPVIVVNEDLGEALKSVNTNVMYLADKFEQIKGQYRDRLFNKLGIMSANVDKRERVQVGEVNATVGQCTDYIYMFIDTFNKQMDTYELPFKMSINGALEELYTEGSTEDDKPEYNTFNE